METNTKNPDYLDESQSLQVIKQMIQVSQKKIKNDGVLFILWGWLSFLTYMVEYLKHYIPHTYKMSVIKGYITLSLFILGVVYTIYYLYQKSRKVTTYIDTSLRYVWISMFFCMVLINLIQNNVLHKIHFELQLPIFMILISFSLVVTGGILRYKMVIIAGAAFGLLAYLASFYDLHQQLLIEAIAWLVSFIIPGHILYANRNK